MLKRKNQPLVCHMDSNNGDVIRNDVESMATNTRQHMQQQQQEQRTLPRIMNQRLSISSSRIIFVAVVLSSTVAIYKGSYGNTVHNNWMMPPNVHAFVVPFTENTIHRRTSTMRKALHNDLLTQSKLTINEESSFHRTSSSNTQSPTISSPAWINKVVSTIGTILLVSSLSLACISSGPVFAENELSAKYGNKGFDTSLVDQNCLLNSCSLQVKNCLQDDVDCRKGLTCTAKCLGDNTCITGCMARYGNDNLDQLLKCTIEDNECIKIAILDGGADLYGTEPLSPIPVVSNFNIDSLTGSWYKVIGYNPNYDCYACQRNTFTIPSTKNDDGMMHTVAATDQQSSVPILSMDVEFSMPHLLPDGSPIPPSSSVHESLSFVDSDNDEVLSSTMQSIALNAYHTRETMIFDQGYLGMNNKKSNSKMTMKNSIDDYDANTMLTLNKGTSNELNYHRTAHSEGEMFGLKFWENWYVIGENDPNESEEFKFIYYNGKTRQNTYSGAFIYSRTKELSPPSMKKVQEIALNAGMNPDQFCRIRNGCFVDEESTSNNIQSQQEVLLATTKELSKTLQSSSGDIFRGILKSTRISELLGVEPVEARDTIRSGNVPTAKILTPNLIMNTEDMFSSFAVSTDAANSDITRSPIILQQKQQQQERPWWNEVGDYFENPHRHFQVMNELRVPVQWPK